jgi:hypothetical protein
MSEEDNPETTKPVFHGAPPQAESSSAKDGKLKKTLAAGLVFGIGSAAVVAALLYTRKAKSKPTAPKVVPEASD